MTKKLEVGLVNTVQEIVTGEMSAVAYGNVGVDVFATPAMIGLIERTAHFCIPLEDGQATVGTKVNVEHLAATPIGMTVTATAEIIEVEGRRILFKIEAHDEVDQIASGTHERFIVNSMEKFLARVAAKGKSA